MQTSKSKSGAATVAVVTLGTFMSSFDVSVVNMALPIIQNTFHAGIASIEWVIVAYLLVLGSTLLAFGRLSDMIGHKRLYVTGFALFTLSSLACSLSPTLTMLIVFRVLQALSAAMMQSSSSPLIMAAVEPQNRGKSLGMLAVAVAVSTCLGPALGGFLASAFGWSSIFLVNVPVGIVGTILSFKVLRADDKAAAPSHFDAPGSILIILALFLIMLPLNLLSRQSVGLPVVLLSLLAGVAALASFILVERRSAHPIINLSLFKSRVFTFSNFAAMLFYASEFVMVFMAPYYFQKLRLFTPTASGLMMLPMSLTMMAAAPISGAIADRFDSRRISCMGLAVMAVGILLFSLCGADAPIPLILFSLMLFGFGGGFFQTPNTSAVMGSVPANRRGIASATLGTMRNIGMGGGEALSAALIALTMNAAAPAFIAKGLKGTQLWQMEFVPAARAACIAAAVCALLALAFSLVRGSLKPSAQAQASVDEA